MKEKFQNGYIKFGVTIFAAGAALIILYQIMVHIDVVRNGIATVWTILSPFVYGLIMAYLLCPIYNIVVRRMYPILSPAFEKKRMRSSCLSLWRQFWRFCVCLV